MATVIAQKSYNALFSSWFLKKNNTLELMK